MQGASSIVINFIYNYWIFLDLGQKLYRSELILMSSVICMNMAE